MKLISVFTVLLFVTYLSKGQVMTVRVNSDSVKAINKTIFYFPLEVFRDTSYAEHASFVDAWYSENLFAMKEPLLYVDTSKDEIYRFTWLRTFNHPIAIRIEKHDTTYLLYWKLCDGAGGYKPGTLTINKSKVISRSQWNNFKNFIGEIDFWNMATNDPSDGGLDGAQWILEGKSPEQYHVVDRWCPKSESLYYQCCNFLINLTDLNNKPLLKY
jgi:hypothetical protein